jgi:opacity protein-like surface antigen
MRKVAIIGIGAILLLSPVPARADVMFTPFIGAAFSGDAPDTRLTYGGALSFTGAGILGVELDFGYTPNFFRDVQFVESSNVVTLMGNLILSAPLDRVGVGIRPYVSGGAGLLRTRIRDEDEFFDVDDDSWGYNAGAGLTGFMTNNVGLRADVRYFRSFRATRTGDDELAVQLGGFNFWRGTVGLAFRF